ncbi:ABC transporter permease [Actinomadura vinacea]|uniref:ABC transporter permease n=1 Tax=Actinomadura vinacea TaxID=115336 RepID=A0ABP5W2Y8_9ACTN
MTTPVKEKQETKEKGRSPRSSGAPIRLLRGGSERLWLIVLVLIGWEIGTRVAEEEYFPPPSKIVSSLHEIWFSGPASRLFLTDKAVDDFSTSLGHLFAGWLVACAVGVVLGVAIGRSRTLNDLLDPVLQFLRAVPPPTLLPFFIMVFQLGATMQIVTIAFSVVWPVLLNSADGARTVEALQLETAKVFGLSRYRRLVTVILPAAGPKIIAGVRVSLGFALILMVLSELVGSTAGIGAQLIGAQRDFDLPAMWAGIVMLGVLGLLFNGAFVLLERRLLGWHSGARRLAN